jgi:hypothetical protein
MPTVILPTPETDDDSINLRFQSIYDRIKSLMQVEEIIMERLNFEVKRAETINKPSIKMC